MTAIDAAHGNREQPVSETASSAMIAMSVEEAAAHFGITPQAVRKRIKAGHLAAERDGRAWRVYVDAQPAQPDEVSENATEGKFRETAKPTNAKPVALSQREQFALMVEPIVAPWVAKVEELSREAERNLQRALAAETERDELTAEVELLRQLNTYQAVAPEHSPVGNVSPDSGKTATSEEARQDAPENARDGSQATKTEPLPNDASNAAEGEISRRAPWWRRLLFGG